MNPQPWLIYALGGGWGHLVRALALARIAAKHRCVQILTNSPYSNLIIAEPNIKLQVFDPNLDLSLIRSRIPQILLESEADCLIVDTFPRGLVGELTEILPQLSIPQKVLIHRDLNPEYVRQKQLETFVQEHFDLVLIPGEGEHLPWAQFPQTQHTEPWLIRSAFELPSRQTAREQLGLSDTETPVVMVLASGRDRELNWYGHATEAIAQSFPRLTVRCLSAIRPPTCPPNFWVCHFPALECLVAADLVLGSGGYNTVTESQALKLPLVARPFPRMYDNQAARLARVSGQILPVTGLAEAMGAIATLLKTPLTPTLPQFINGVDRAEQLIRQLNQD